MVNIHGSTQLAIKQRREVVILIMGTLRNEGKYASIDAVHQRIQQVEQTQNKKKVKPYSKISRDTIAEDLRRINVENSFVRDIAQYNYSQLKENHQATLQWIYNEAQKNYEKIWTQSKTITRETKDGDYTEEVTTAELAQPKAAFLSIMKDCVKQMDEMIGGRTVDISVALLTNRFKELEKVEEEHETLKRNYEKLVMTTQK